MMQSTALSSSPSSSPPNGNGSTQSHDSKESPVSVNTNGRFQPKGQVGYRPQAEFIEAMYESWKVDPKSVDSSWNSFFEGFELGIQLPPPIDDTSFATSVGTATAATPTFAPTDKSFGLKQARVYQFISAYRTRGHLKANLDPLKLDQSHELNKKEFELSQFGLSSSDLSTRFDSDGLLASKEGTLSEIITALEATYCQTIGVEYTHLNSHTPRSWLQQKMESCRNQAFTAYPKEKKKRILQKLQQAELFERFLHTRFVGQKRFSLEGGDALIPMLDSVIQMASSMELQEIVIGMAHRGRLNVLANILGKPYRNILDEFSEHFVPKSKRGDGDVKYHMGYKNEVPNATGQKVRLELAANPSHLESVNPVVEGIVKAHQCLQGNEDAQRHIMPLLIHGDAAFMGQGIVAETLNMSQLEGYRTGGTLHIVINNQIGFTTSPNDARSSTYCTALAKAIEAPIFHVNADDPLAAVYLVELATSFRQEFKQDVVIDLICYRKHGHNEGDEPSFTQPIIYRTIQSHPSVVELLSRSLISNQEITSSEVEAFSKDYNDQLTAALTQSKSEAGHAKIALREPISTPELLEPIQTAVSKATLEKIGQKLSEEPGASTKSSEFKLNPKIAALLKSRRAMIEGKEGIDWGFGEALAFGTLLTEGFPIRLSGQDCRRGTFSHRHAVLYDTESRNRYFPLSQLASNKTSFNIFNSPLSEEAVLGFEFGYSLAQPKGLVLWEAQFGDFVNGAQNIIDQYITSSESKWENECSLVLLLPHGYHGQGPEHSSARMERFLQSCAEDNMIVANCTTPASYFHLLRRQAIRKIRKPLVIMTPKGLLRDKRATSNLEEFTKNKFEEILTDSAAPKDATRVILCSGKVYYDLVDFRTQNPSAAKTAILRLEQLYPLHEAKLKEMVNTFTKAKSWIWCQEESHNMGAWNFIEPRLRKLFGKDWKYAGRDESASPATGSHAIHELEQKQLVAEAFNI